MMNELTRSQYVHISEAYIVQTVAWKAMSFGHELVGTLHDLLLLCIFSSFLDL